MTDRNEASEPSGQTAQLLLDHNPDCIAETKRDAQQLAQDLLLLKDALKFRVLKNGWTVRTAIDFMSNGEAIVSLSKSVDPASKFHEDFLAFRDLLRCLTDWMGRELFSEDDLIKDAKEKIEEQAFDLDSLLKGYQ